MRAIFRPLIAAHLQVGALAAMPAPTLEQLLGWPSMRSLVARLVRPALRPVWRRVQARLENRITPAESRIGSVEHRIAGLEARVAGYEQQPNSVEVAWNQHLPGFLNAVSAVGAFGHELRRGLDGSQRGLDELRRGLHESRRGLDELRSEITRLDRAGAELDSRMNRAEGVDGELETTFTAEAGRIWSRLEFIRREILFEMQSQSGPGTSGGKSELGAAPITLSPEKLAEQRASPEGLRVNLGCGHVPLDCYVNIDQRELPDVDIVANVGHLPFEQGSLNEITSAHLLEHFPQETLRRRLLPYWHGLLAPGGRFHAVVPDGATMLSTVGGEAYPFEQFREALFGAQDYDGDYHFNLLTPESLRGLLEEAGFREIVVPTAGRRNGKCFEFEINARR